MVMPGRSFAIGSTSYRYGMNGQEKETETFDGASSAEFWMYDSRTGRRFENDPLVYEWQSPYATFNNNPIYYSDPSGLEGEGDDKKSEPGDPKKRTYNDKGEGKGGYDPASKDPNTKKDSGYDGTYDWESADNGKTTYVKYTHRESKTGGYYTVPSENNSNGDIASNGDKGAKKENEELPGSRKKEGKTGTDNENKNKKNKSTPDTKTDPSAGSLKPSKVFRPNIKLNLPQRGAVNNPRRIPPNAWPNPRPNVRPNPPPPGPNPNNLCFTCWIGSSQAHWMRGVTQVATWLNNNPDYNISIFSDGGGLFGNTWKDKPLLSNKTYTERLLEQYSKFFLDVKKAMNGKMTRGRLGLDIGDANGETLKFNVVPKK